MSNHVEAIESASHLIADFVDRVIAISDADYPRFNHAEKVEGVRMFALDYARQATASIEGLDEYDRENLMASLRRAIEDRLANWHAVVAEQRDGLDSSVEPNGTSEKSSRVVTTAEMGQPAPSLAATSVASALRPELREALMATFEQDEAAYRYLGR